jgi:CPA2 family monovalent cation:H+ antiporter-2
LTLLVGGLAEQIHVSAAIGAFLVGVALSGAVQHRATSLITPMRDLFAAVFFVFFSFGVDPTDLRGAIVPVAALTALTVPGKLVVGHMATGRRGAGGVLIARGEFSIICAALGATLADGADLGAVAAGYVLVTSTIGPLVAARELRRAPEVGLASRRLRR